MSDTNAKKQLSEEAFNIVQAMRDSLLLLDKDLKVVSANKSFYSTFKVTAENTIGEKIYDLGNKQWDIPELKALLEKTLTKEEKVHNFRLSHKFPDIGERLMLLNACRNDHTNMILLIITDITSQEKAYSTLKASAESVDKITGFMVGREVRMVELKAEIAKLKKSISESLPKS
ncbi:MAG: PAS domain-containing protein [bacterium]|nr:PAS domain-containing protein [bacterium]